ncbi:cyclin-dependent protein kinase complex component [Colletotrichum plurivorum]|uniref:Cyclin-dependent protein kinase complex component n=1 Tax=Colletotrichum plurivorum TaxID=2175906 RepID=A0A8H6N2G9_9PEZI|nr:cyclin-dependent protein kinase complex component [Colletotrichum plurivorum]
MSSPLLKEVESKWGDAPKPPTPPRPSQASKAVLDNEEAVLDDKDPPNVPYHGDLDDEFSRLTPRAAMRLVGRGIELLVQITGDIPPTPPPTSPTVPNMRGMMAERELIRSNSEKNLARMMQEAARETAQSAASSSRDTPTSSQLSGLTISTPEPIDGVRLRQRPRPSCLQPPPRSRPPEPYIIIGENQQPINVQHSAISRRFYARQVPPFTVSAWLERFHTYCPMSTGVYLAASMWIHRLVVKDQSIVLSTRSAHRLTLGALWVSMKALEDNSWSQSKISKIGGITRAELTRLEIGFLFLTNWELAVTRETLKTHWEVLKAEDRLSELYQRLPVHPQHRYRAGPGPPKEQAPAGKENERPDGP